MAGLAYMGYIKTGELRQSIQALCKEHGLENVEIKIEHPPSKQDAHRIVIIHRTDVDPHEESNAVSWGDN